MPDRESFAQPEWQRLFRRATPEGALREVAAWIGDADRLALSLEVPGEAGPETVSYRGAATTEGAGRARFEAAVPGRPEWRLALSGPTEALSQECADQAAWSLAAWRVARLEQSRADARLR